MIIKNKNNLQKGLGKNTKEKENDKENIVKIDFQQIRIRRERMNFSD